VKNGIEIEPGATGIHLNDGLASFVHDTRTPLERVL
jgi:hypothetical protein